MNTVDILLGAKEALLTRGWYQGGMRGKNGEVCLLGATKVAAKSVSYDSGARAALLGTLGISVAPAAPGGIGTWNDVPGRTFNEVIDLIDSTLVRLKEAPEV